nr:HepT-like ribonuclease domain-containing protein [Natranaerobius thermophilus]
MYDNSYINDKEKDLFIRIIGMRNVLVHDYLEIEKETVYRILTENLSDLKSLLKKYMEFIMILYCFSAGMFCVDES